MSNSSQDEYLRSLKQIKESEEKVEKEIDSHRNQVQQEIKKMEADLKNDVNLTKLEGKKMIEKNIEMAKQEAHKEANNIIHEAEHKSKTLSVHSDPQLIDEIMKILLSDI